MSKPTFHTVLVQHKHVLVAVYINVGKGGEALVTEIHYNPDGSLNATYHFLRRQTGEVTDL